MRQDGGLEVERDRGGRTPLHYAALDGRIEDVARLIEAGLDVDALDSNGMVPLHLAAQQHQAAVVELLCEAGATVDVADVNGNTPLFRAVFESRGRGEIITVLLLHGADPNRANAAGVSPRELAERIGNFDVRRLMPD